MSACITTEPSQPQERRPNVLIILTDDQRDSLQAMPATRRLFADGGTTFRNAFATTPLCCPSRVSIFTGRYTHNHGVKNNFEAEKLDQATTLQAALKSAGFRTGFFGKYLNHWDVSRPPRYFDQWALFPATRDSLYYYGSPWNVEGEVREVDTYSTEFIERHALRFLRNADGERDEQPWLMYVSTPAPHTPFTPEPRYANVSFGRWNATAAVMERDLSDKPSYVETGKCSLRCARTTRVRQLRTLMSVDDLVSKLYATLRSLEEQHNTLALFLSDNGELWGEHGLTDKRVPYSPSISIPMLLRWPARVAAGVEDRRLVGTIDVAPTILDAAGVTDGSERAMDGRSLLDPRWERKRLLIEYWREPGRRVPDWASLRTRSRQYVEYYGANGRVTTRELYDLESDPWQLRNLMSDDDDPTNDPPRRTIASLAARVQKDRDCSRETCP